MPQNQSKTESARSMPCIEMPTILHSSDHSLSFKSFNSAPTNDLENNNKPTESRVSVKSLIDKFGSRHGNSYNNNQNNFNIKKKPLISTVPEKLETPCNESTTMKGDAIRVDDAKDIVKNHVFKIFTATTHFEPNSIPLQVDKNAVRTVRFSLKNSESDSEETEDNTDKRFWRNIVAMFKVNRVYHQCMVQIMDREKFPDYKDIKEYVTSVLKKGEESEFMESELIDYIKKYLEKFSIKLNSKLNQELNKTQFLTQNTRMNILQMELDKMKTNMIIAQRNSELLQKENKELVNTLNSYNDYNIHKVSLEKRLKFEQDKNDKLKATITSIFEKKMLSYNASEDNSSNYHKI